MNHASKLFFCVGLLFWIALLLMIDVLRRVKPFLQPAWSTPLLKDYKPRNGDILLVHYVGHGLHGVPIAEAYPTHTAFVYVKDDGQAFALEATRFAAPEQPNVFLKTVKKLSGIRMVPLAHFVNAVDSVIYIRQLEEGNISSSDVESCFDWASNLKFETRILDSMTLDVTIAIGFRLVWPVISKACMHISKLEKIEKREDQVFCSEFVSRLLSRVGAVRKDFRDHYLVSPASYLATASLADTRVEPNLESIASSGFKWKNDQMLVRAGYDKKF